MPAVTQAVAKTVAMACSMIVGVAISNTAGQEASIHRQQLSIVHGSHPLPLVYNSSKTADAGDAPTQPAPKPTSMLHSSKKYRPSIHPVYSRCVNCCSCVSCSS